MIAQLTATPRQDSESLDADVHVAALERDGITRLPTLLSPDQLRGMQQAFAARLKRQRWNDIDGYEKNERYRHMVHDVLLLDQGFVDLALHPLVKDVLRGYLGDHFALVEAKGWKSLPTTRDFHGWHGDQWYDETQVTDRIPREVKLAFYLTDVKSGAFKYLKGSHGKQVPRPLRKAEAQDIPEADVMEVLAPAGSAVLFDTSGIHRQAIPILEPRQAVFLNYRDPRVPVMQEDKDYYRYHPLLLNAALLGNLSEEDYRILGFGDKTNYQPLFERTTPHPGFHRLISRIYDVKVLVREYRNRLLGKLGRVMGQKY